MKYLFFVVITGIITASCKKDDVPPVANISINVVNASPGISNAKIKTTNANGYYNQLSGVNYGSFAVFTMPQRSPNVSISSSTDTAQVLYSSNIPAIEDKSGGSTVYSLFIAGAVGEDILLSPDNIPFHADSTLGVRFINLSKNSSPVSINIQGQANGSEESSLAYKSLSEFKSYSATSAVSDYSFEFRDAASGSLITTYTVSGVNALPNYALFKNLTIVFYGPLGSQSTFGVNNF